MASSKDAGYVAIPKPILFLADQGIVSCRPPEYHYGNPFDDFLSKVSETTNDCSEGRRMCEKVKAVMLFHNYFDEIGTAVISIYYVYLDLAGHRIDFVHSDWMNKFHGCPNFWAGFGMAIARVKEDCPECGEEDPHGLKFVELVQKFGIESSYLAKQPQNVSPKKPGDCPTCKDAEHSYDGNPFVPPKGSVQQVTFICPDCGQRWWQFNTYFHLWKAVDRLEFAAVQRNEMLRPYLDMQ